MNIKDYLKYYIGCPAVNSWFPEDHQEYNKGWVLTAIQLNLPNPYKLETKEEETWTDSVKPILRQLHSITNAECGANAWTDKKGFDRFVEANTHNGTMRWYADDFHYLLSLGIDLFGLIEAGLAVDADTLNQQTEAR